MKIKIFIKIEKMCCCCSSGVEHGARRAKVEGSIPFNIVGDIEKKAFWYLN
jgi:hypothetical protein